ncbi:glycosyltransferase [Cyanobium sp. To12R1]|uniref:glycosyltransferase n=1 Tax=Cyanobium sp. To12R1 TaxID=2823723 RepID=UPI0020CE93E0|nr:glycosyltransferase [Cyanobium sp. To12R1]
MKRLGLSQVLYHEHDAPSPAAANTVFMKYVYAARRAAVRVADVIVVPNEERLAKLVAESGRRGPSVCVWNCPSVDEVAASRAALDSPLTLYYHGSLNNARLPFTVLEAMSRVEHPLRLLAIGYETIESRGYREAFQQEARRLGLGDRVQFDGPLDHRKDLMMASRKTDVGLAMMPLNSDDSNMSSMTGASNKAFDYLAGGLALVVSDLPDWRNFYVAPGYGLSANPDDAGSLAAAFGRLASNPTITRRMGEEGRIRIAKEWNYETQFSAVLALLNVPSHNQ